MAKIMSNVVSFWSAPENLRKKIFEDLIFLRTLEFCGRFVNFLSEDLFFGEHFRVVSLALASSIPVPGPERVCRRKVCPWPRIFFASLASSLVSSTPTLLCSYSAKDKNIWFAVAKQNHLLLRNKAK